MMKERESDRDEKEEDKLKLKGWVKEKKTKAKASLMKQVPSIIIINTVRFKVFPIILLRARRTLLRSLDFLNPRLPLEFTIHPLLTTPTVIKPFQYMVLLKEDLCMCDNAAFLAVELVLDGSCS